MSNIDTYISKASQITQPIVIHLHQLIKTACPTIDEQIKWNAPSFELNGNIVCSVMAFKGHVNFIITQGKFLNTTLAGLESIGEKSNMTGFKGIKTLADLPKDAELIALIQKAAEYSKTTKRFE
ncbi:MAG: hypothetical protein GQ574_19570 [Crocinitomix sp.]|nr:hypothetical protein [Crocinitomix sp.]